MKNIYPLIFSFGDSLRYKINEQDRKYFFSTTRALLNNEECSWGTIPDHENWELFFTIPISATTPSRDNNVLQYRFNERVRDKFKIIKDNKFINDNTIILIEIKEISRDQLIFPLSLSISEILASEPKNVPRIIMFLDRLPTRDDTIFSIIYKLSEEGKIILVDKAGTALPANAGVGSFKLEKFLSSRKHRDIDLHEAIKRKLIRKHGHFERLDKSPYCNRFFYDASYCIAEIRQLIVDFITSSAFKSEKFEYIIQLSQFTKWFPLAVSGADGYLKSVDAKGKHKKYKNYKGVIIFHEIDHNTTPAYGGGNILLVADVIDTGKSIRESLPIIFKMFPNLATESLLKLAVLNNASRGNADKTTKVRKISLSGTDYEFHYMAEFESNEFERNKTCPQCLLHLEHTSIEDEPPYTLTSYDYWEFNKKYGLVPENYGYGNREALPLIPHFIKWFEDDAPYFVQKFLLNLNENGITHPFTLVFPDEIENEEGHNLTLEETASGKFVIRLKEIFSDKYIQYIGIPRKTIEDLKNNKIQLTELDSLSDDWLYNLNNLPTDQRIIIIDEFHKGGSTISTIIRILTYYKKMAVCYFPLVDFNPIKSSKYEEEYKIKVLSLYSFNFS